GELAWGPNVGAVGFFRHFGTELAEHFEVVVDRAVADLTTTKIRDERAAHGVHERTTKEDGNPGVASKRIDFSIICCFDAGRIHRDLAGFVIMMHFDTVQPE